MFSLKVLVLRLTTHNSQQQQRHSRKQPTNPNPSILHPSPSIHQSTPPHPSSVSLLYTVVNKEVEQQFSGRGETCLPTSLNINNLGKAAVLHFVFTLFCS
jgi:hypothetical protein